MKILLLISLAVTCAFAFENSDNFINEINNKQNLWRAGRNFHENTPESYIRSLLGSRTLPKNVKELIPIKYHDIEVGELPESFDARTKWPECKTIKEISDQSSCGSCWAVSTASAISNRICIHSEGKLQPEISSRNILSCNSYLPVGCYGGIPFYAWYFWTTTGIVTGGPYGSKIGCQPYPFPPCEHYVNGSHPQCPAELSTIPECVQSCDTTSINYKDDLNQGASAYRLSKKENQIRAEIFKNGPLVAGFVVYSDFLQYKSGIYTHTSGSKKGRHAVRLIGWGEENGTKYWLVANSWNEDWGDKGFFKIRRGVDECEVESEVSAGLPK